MDGRPLGHVWLSGRWLLVLSLVDFTVRMFDEIVCEVFLEWSGIAGDLAALEGMPYGDMLVLGTNGLASDGVDGTSVVGAVGVFVLPIVLFAFGMFAEVFFEVSTKRRSVASNFATLVSVPYCDVLCSFLRGEVTHVWCRREEGWAEQGWRADRRAGRQATRRKRAEMMLMA